MGVFPGMLAGWVAALLAGCAGSPPRPSSDQNLVTADPDSLRVTLELGREIRVGQPVPMVVRLENTGERPLDLYLRGRTIAFDIIVTHADGEMVWQRLKDEIIPAIIQLKVLQAGEVLELKDTWTQRDNRDELIGPGRYRVRGTVLTDRPPPLETPWESLQVVES